MAVSAILTRLALHYWRPDFTPLQVKLLLSDYLADLTGFTPEQVNSACTAYRRLPGAKFFPKVGELLELLKPDPAPSRARLPTFRGYPALESRQATKSVAQILRENGMDRAAAGWERA